VSQGMVMNVVKRCMNQTIIARHSWPSWVSCAADYCFIVHGGLAGAIFVYARLLPRAIKESLRLQSGNATKLIIAHSLSYHWP
jgi:hypothetical protein